MRDMPAVTAPYPASNPADKSCTCVHEGEPDFNGHAVGCPKRMAEADQLAAKPVMLGEDLSDSTTSRVLERISAHRYDMEHAKTDLECEAHRIMLAEAMAELERRVKSATTAAQ